MYTLISDRLPIAYQDVIVKTIDGKEVPAYRSAWGKDFVNSNTYDTVKDVVSWKLVLKSDMVSINQY